MAKKSVKNNAGIVFIPLAGAILALGYLAVVISVGWL